MDIVLLISIVVLANVASWKMAVSRGRHAPLWLAGSLLASPVLVWLCLAIMGKTEEKKTEELLAMKELLKA